MRPSRTKVLAVSSGGGHWVQLRRLAGAFEGQDVAFVTVDEGYRGEVRGARFYRVIDANLTTRVRLLVLAVQLLRVVLRERPEVVISTGAAPGFFAVWLAKKLLGSRTVWIDSVANAEKMSVSGQKVGKYADVWLTQWEHLAVTGGPAFAGRII